MREKLEQSLTGLDSLFGALSKRAFNGELFN